ncbi:hypothetical protein BH18ACT12_BH18ACT12_05070 [soil metagenome]
MSKEHWSYVLWGSFAVALLIPELLASVGKNFTPFPGFVRTAANLTARVPRVAMVILAGLAILAVHIVFYPWPDLARD